MQDIANDIQEGKITCVADGSYNDNHGTAAWKITNMDNTANFI